jgi:starvation-inducible DNA-binding protein
MKAAEDMKIVLANTFALYLKAHNFHWNVVGEDFHQYHAFFGEVYQQLFDAIDPIAEEIRQLGVFVPGSLSRFQSLTTIKDEVMVPETQEMLAKLLSDNNKVIESLEKAYKSAEEGKHIGLTNFIQDRVMAHTKLRWKLESSIE